MRVAGHDRVFAIADEDLERETDTKTSSVHFLRFELSPPMIREAKRGAAIAVGADHSAYDHDVTLPDDVRHSLASDLT